LASRIGAHSSVVPPALGEQLGLHSVGAGEPRDHDRNAPREHDLQGPDGRELIDPGRLEGGALGGVLSGSTTNFCARVPCFPALCAERALL
jgi:hypothetical protein